ncbi:MAG: GatB/YqeY domain-containing protein [Chloroflexi bacterium]|nr:GatB/YqeY domain-containing protein [Chloroflexota bacterium]
MSLREQLVEELKAAMRQRNELLVSTLRLLRADIQNREIELRKPLDDAGVLAIISKQVRQRQESIEAFRKGNRPEMADREEAEMAILQEYLPEQLPREEVEALAAKVIEEVGAAGPGDLGKVMGPLMQQVRGKADGGEVRSIVSELLSSS